MAESFRLKGADHLTCSVCFGQFQDPKVLPCLHSYCHGCIVKLIKNAKSNKLNCPRCPLAIEVDKTTISKLPSNVFVNNLLGKMALTNDKPVAKKLLCDNCVSEDTAKSRCNECGMNLCQFCAEFHKRSRLLKNHELLNMEELEFNPGVQEIAEKVQCSKHKKEIIRLFCKTCQTTACRDCIITDHRQHDSEFLEKVAAEEKQHLQQNLNEVKQRKARVVQGIINLKEFDKILEAKKDSTISKINNHFDELTKSLAESFICLKNKMMAKATSLSNSKQKKIDTQLQVLEVALASCENSIEFTERALNNGNDIQTLGIEKYILQSLGQLKAVKDEMTPCVTEDMIFVIPSSSVGETKEKFLKEYDVNVDVSSPTHCHASFDRVKSVSKKTKRLEPGRKRCQSLSEVYEGIETGMEVGQQYSITLVCCDKKNQKLNYGGQHIKPSFTGMDVGDVFATDNKDGSHSISFRPCQGGMLKFQVSINGIPAPNCSLTKQVNWVISDGYGQGFIHNGGRTMNGESVEGEYCWRVGGCYFESGVHTWKVKLSRQELFLGDSRNPAHSSIEVGIIDYSDINESRVQNGEKWVYEHDVQANHNNGISLSLDMEKKTLNVMVDLQNYGRSRCVKSHRFTAQRVSPFFACSSPYLSISLVE